MTALHQRRPQRVKRSFADSIPPLPPAASPALPSRVPVRPLSPADTVLCKRLPVHTAQAVDPRNEWFQVSGWVRWPQTHPPRPLPTTLGLGLPFFLRMLH